MIQPLITAATVALLLSTLPAYAAAASPDSPSPDDTGAYSQVALDDLRDLRGKFVGLAQALPSEHYSWRPTEEARSVSELFTHVASATYFHVAHLGSPIPPGSFKGHPNLEKLTSKPDVIAVLKAALDHAERHLVDRGPEPLAGSFSMLTHLHEHLGQAIAYARSVGIAPPWFRVGSDHTRRGG